MIATPITCLPRKDQPFSWGVEAENAFQSLKASFTTISFFIHANLSKPFVLETNTFDFALGAVFLQPERDNLLHPFDFCFRKFFLVKINYEIHDK
jgi:hypothetical protein